MVVACVVQEGAEGEGPIGGVVEVAWIDGDSGGAGGGAVEEVPGDALLLAIAAGKRPGVELFKRGEEINGFGFVGAVSGVDVGELVNVGRGWGQ